VRSTRLPDEDRVAQEVEAKLAQIQKIVDAIGRDQVHGDQKQILATIQDFAAKARDALTARELLRAKALADKASTLAEEVASAGKPPR
jgi:hypothetical protein